MVHPNGEALLPEAIEDARGVAHEHVEGGDDAAGDEDGDVPEARAEGRGKVEGAMCGAKRGTAAETAGEETTAATERGWCQECLERPARAGRRRTM